MATDKKDNQQSPVLCDICGAEMIERNCELVCPICGFTRDCTDP